MNGKRRRAKSDRLERERREFLKKFGRFAAATPPLITAILAAPALADSWQSGGHHNCRRHRCQEDGNGGNGQGQDGNGQGWGNGSW